MAIITKNSNTADAVPAAADLSVGELAVNTADGRLYTKHTDGSVKTIGAIDVSTKAPLNSPALTGTPTAPTAAADTNTTQIATTAFVQASKTAITTSFTASGSIAATNVQAAIEELDSETIKTGHVDANLIRINATGTGNTPFDLGVELTGNGSANTVKPGVGFHQPTLFAGTLTQEDSYTFAFKRQDGAIADLHAHTVSNYYTPRMASFQHDSNGQVSIYGEWDPYDIIWPRGNYLQVNRAGHFTFLLLGDRSGPESTIVSGRIYQNGGLVAEIKTGADNYGHTTVMAAYTSGHVPAGTQYQFRCDGAGDGGDGIIFAFWTDGAS